MRGRMKSGVVAIMVPMALISLAGCATKKPLPPPAAPATVVVAAAPAGNIKPATRETGETPPAPVAAAPGERIYFAPGASDIDGDGMALLRLCADRLKSDERRRVTLVGMTDDLGSRTYNVAIADRRIATVQLALRRLGVAAHQIKRRNLGGEMAQQQRCTTEPCRRLMRRVELHCDD